MDSVAAKRKDRDGWRKSSESMRNFNGLVCATFRTGREYGVFEERFATGGMRWGVRSRPIDAKGNPLDSWGHATPCRTKAEAMGFVPDASYTPAEHTRALNRLAADMGGV